MKTINYIFALIFIVLGICIITISKIIEEIIPKLGFAAYQSAAAGSYNPDNYRLELTLNYWIGILCILYGFVYLLLNSNFIKNELIEIKARNKEFEEKRRRVAFGSLVLTEVGRWLRATSFGGS